MDKSQLELIIKARNLAKTELDKARRQVDTLNKRVENVGRSFSNLGNTLLPVSAAVGGFFAGSIKLAADQEKAFEAVESRIRNMGSAATFSAQEAGEMAARLQEVSTFGDEDILQNVTQQLLTFRGIASSTPEHFERVQTAVLDLSTVLGTNLKDQSIQLAKALEDPVKGVTALSRAGVTFTDQQRDMIQVMVESGDVLAAQNLILTEVEKNYGGAASDSVNTFSGALKQLRNTLGDVMEDIGDRLIPMIQYDLIPKIKGVVNWWNKLSDSQQTFYLKILALIALLPILIKMIGIVSSVLAGMNPVTLAVIAVVAGLIVAILEVNEVLNGNSQFWGRWATELGKSIDFAKNSFGNFIDTIRTGLLAQAKMFKGDFSDLRGFRSHRRWWSINGDWANG